MTSPLLFDFTLEDFLRAQHLFSLTERALQETDATGAAIAVKQDDLYVCFATAGETAPSLGVSLRTDEGITGACIRSGQTEICHDAVFDDRVNAAACESLGIRSVIAVPVLDHGEVVGVMEALSREPNAFGAAEQNALEALALQFHRATPAEFHGARLEAPVTIDRFSSAAPALEASTVNCSTKVPDVAPSPALPQADTKTPSATDEQLTLAIYDQREQQGSWIRGIVIAILFVSLAILTSILFVRRGTETPPQQHVLAPASSTSAPAVPPAASVGPSLDTPTGIAELKVAASAGNAASQLKLARAFVQGKGVPKDLVSAYAWYIAASLSGAEDPTGLLPSLSKTLSAVQMAEVRVKVAEMFWKGTGVKQDSTTAYSWLLLAQAAGAPKAREYKQRLATGMNDVQIHEAEQKANAWLKQHHQPILRR